MNKRSLLWAVSIALFYFSAVGWLWDTALTKKSKEAEKLYSEDNFTGALSKWRDAQIDNPDRKELHYNIGNALHKDKQYGDAYREYEMALDSKNDGLRAKTYYNMGNTNFRLGELEDAIKDYEKALEINPDDEDAKYNVEFIKKLLEEREKQKTEKKESRQEKGQKETGQPEEEEGQETKKEKDEQQGKQSERDGEEKEAKEKQGREGKMSEEDAVRLLDALKDDEKEIQKQLRTQPTEGRYNVDKDW